MLTGWLKFNDDFFPPAKVRRTFFRVFESDREFLHTFAVSTYGYMPHS